MVDAKVIFATLYSFITFKHLDPPDNYFRCKLVCTLLDSCGQYFRKGKKSDLDTFLVYFQRYLFAKTQPLPVDTEISVYDTMEFLRPRMALFESLEDADEAVQEIERKYNEKLAKLRPTGQQHQTTGDDANTSSPTMAGLAGDGPHGGGGDDGEGEDDGSGDDSDSDNSYVDDGEDEDVLGEEEGDGDTVKFLAGGHEDDAEYEPDPDDDQFVNEYNRLMQETIEARRNDSSINSIQKLDVAIPMNLKGSKPKTVEEDGRGESKVVFTLLSRKGNKQEAKPLVVPLASGMADKMLARQEAEIAEREKNKQFVMNYEKRALEQEMTEQAIQQRQAQGGYSRTRGGTRITTKLFSNSRGRGGRGRPGMLRFGGGAPQHQSWRQQQSQQQEEPKQRSRPSGKYDFEGSLLRDMGYGKDKPDESYRGGQPVFNPE